MKILFAADVPPDPDSGAAGTEWRTIEALKALGHEVDAIWADDLGRKIRHGNLHYLFELPWRYRTVLAERCAKKTYDVLHVNQSHCFLAAQDHRRLRRPGVFVYRSHGLDDHMEQVLRGWRKRLAIRPRRGVAALAGPVIDRMLARHDRLAYRHVDGVLVSSSLDRTFLIDQIGLAPERVACVPQAPAAPFVASPAAAMTPGRLRRLLHVGGFAYWKGVHAVARAANELLIPGSDMRLSWVCRQEEHQRVRDLLTVEAQARVELVPWMAQERLVDLYDDHGIFLSPSLFEGFGKVFLEAMARGLCVIGTVAGGMGDVISDGLDGLMVDFDSSAGIVEQVRRLRTDPEFAKAISVKASATARDYSWQRTATEIAGFYMALAVFRDKKVAAGSPECGAQGR